VSPSPGDFEVGPYPLEGGRVAVVQMAWRADDAATPDRGHAEPRAVLVLGPPSGALGPVRIDLGPGSEPGPGARGGVSGSPPSRAARDAIGRCAWTAPARGTPARVHAVRFEGGAARRVGGGRAIDPAAPGAGEGRP